MEDLSVEEVWRMPDREEEQCGAQAVDAVLMFKTLVLQRPAQSRRRDKNQVIPPNINLCTVAVQERPTSSQPVN